MSKYVYNKQHCEYLRHQAKQQFDKVRATWIDCGKWAAPHKIQWMLGQTEGERNNHHIVDGTHILALRSYVAGFLEGNTSATRPWFRHGVEDEALMKYPVHKEWLEFLSRRTFKLLASSNFYHEAGDFYYDIGTFNTGAHYIDEIQGRLHFHTLIPGSYFVINNALGEAVVLVREFSLTVKALVDRYGKKKNGDWDWSNFSSQVKKLYEDGNYTTKIDVVHIVEENEHYDVNKPEVLLNKRWVSKTYELGGNYGTYLDPSTFAETGPREQDGDKYLKIAASRRKPFIVGTNARAGNFEYGQKGPTLDALGCIKSLNKKAISKDRAIEQVLEPATQGPANLRKSYITTAPRHFVPIDPSAYSKRGLEVINPLAPAGAQLLTADVQDLRQMVDRFYYADYLLYLTKNPKTRTAAETNAIVQEQQLVIGPNLQSLNFTYNLPVFDFITDYVLTEDPYLPPPPPDLAGRFLRPEFISVFAQAQKAADLPTIDRAMAAFGNIGALKPEMWDKVNLDRLADLYEDRLYLPAGLVRSQDETDAIRERAMREMQRRQQMEQMVQAAGAAKDVGLQVNNKPPGGQG